MTSSIPPSKLPLDCILLCGDVGQVTQEQLVGVLARHGRQREAQPRLKKCAGALQGRAVTQN